jgi:hypothetical protein
MISAYREYVVKRNLKCRFCCFSLNQIQTWPHRKLLYTSSTAVVLYGSKCHSFLEIHADKAKMHICCSSQTNNFLGYVSNLAPVSSSFSSVIMSSALCIALKLLLTTSCFFYNFVTVWNVHAEKHLFVFTTPLVGLVFSIDTVRRCEATKVFSWQLLQLQT